RWSGRAGRRFAGLDAVAKAVAIRPGPDLRDEAIACMALTDLRILPGWETDRRHPWTAFDPALERYAVCIDDARGNITVRLVADHREVLRLSGPGDPAEYFRFSPDGRYLAVHYDPNNQSQPNRFLVWDLGRAQPVVAIGPGDWGGSWVFSPDSRRLAVGRRDSSISIFDLGSGRELRRLGQVPTPCNLAWHPDGSKLAATDGPIGGGRGYDVGTRRRPVDLQPPQLPPGGRPAWGPDGTKTAQTCSDGAGTLWDAPHPGPP